MEHRIKHLFGIVTGLFVSAVSPAVLADDADTGITIPQASSIPNKEAPADDESQLNATNPAEGGDYQGDVLSNPMISDIGRAESLTKGGGNTAIINQSGRSNRSSVTQSGNNNSAAQTQTGNSNDLTVNQTGDDNNSMENQKGNYNHKVVIQNGKKEETTNGKKHEDDTE